VVKPKNPTMKTLAKTRLDVQEVEEIAPKEGLTLKGRVYKEPEETAKDTAFGWDEREFLTFWTDGSRQDNKSVGAAVVWHNQNDDYHRKGTYLGRNKEISDAELFALGEAVKHAARNPEDERPVAIFTDSQATLTRIQDDSEGPGQALTRRILAWEKEIIESGRSIEYHWCPGHAGVPGNEAADQTAKEAAARDTTRLSDLETEIVKWTSLSHLHRQSTDLRGSLRREWVEEKCKDHPQYKPRKRLGLRKPLQHISKRKAAVFYQLLSGHALIGTYLKRIGKLGDPSCKFCMKETALQTREHLFNECRYWARERKDFYKSINYVEGYLGKGITRMKVSKLFSDERLTECILAFLKDTQIGRRPGRPPDDDHDWGGD
jgi:ribonuclease HI